MTSATLGRGQGPNKAAGTAANVLETRGERDLPLSAARENGLSRLATKAK